MPAAGQGGARLRCGLRLVRRASGRQGAEVLLEDNPTPNYPCPDVFPGCPPNWVLVGFVSGGARVNEGASPTDAPGQAYHVSSRGSPSA